MPSYDFRCGDCRSLRRVRVGYEESRALELICTVCGGPMRVAPVTSVGVLRGASKETPARAASAKPCGHKHHCRCHIKLRAPNPFAKAIRQAKGSATEE